MSKKKVQTPIYSAVTVWVSAAFETDLFQSDG